MPCIKIRQLGDKVACSGLHMSKKPEVRKLEIGEVVDIPASVPAPGSAGPGRPGKKWVSLTDFLLATGKVDLTTEAPTRPFAYKDYREAKLCSPSFKPRDDAEKEERDVALSEVRRRLQNPVKSSSKEGEEGKNPVQPEAVEVVNAGQEGAQSTMDKSTNRRAQRRARAEAVQDGEQVST